MVSLVSLSWPARTVCSDFDLTICDRLPFWGGEARRALQREEALPA